MSILRFPVWHLFTVLKIHQGIHLGCVSSICMEYINKKFKSHSLCSSQQLSLVFWPCPWPNFRVNICTYK